VAGINPSNSSISIACDHDFYFTQIIKIKTDYIVAVQLSTI
jgi:hypothetical protein